MNLEDLTTDQQNEISGFVNDLNEKLESAVQDSTQHAFNFGCSMSLIPMVVLVILVLFLTRFNWIVTVAVASMSLLLVLGLAAWVAFTARKNASNQTYQLHIAPEIERALRQYNLTRLEFDSLAGGILSPDALLQNYLTVPEADQEVGSDSALENP